MDTGNSVDYGQKLCHIFESCLLLVISALISALFAKAMRLSYSSVLIRVKMRRQSYLLMLKTILDQQKAYYSDCMKSSKFSMEKVQSMVQVLSFLTMLFNLGLCILKILESAVCSEGENFQVNYLIDEAHACGKGANSIVSMVHHFLQFSTPRITF